MVFTTTLWCTSNYNQNKLDDILFKIRFKIEVKTHNDYFFEIHSRHGPASHNNGFSFFQV